MRKLIITLLFMSVCSMGYCSTAYTVDPFITPEDVSIEHLETFRTVTMDGLNNWDGSNTQSGSITTTQLDANARTDTRWNEAFNDFVYTGLIPPTTSSTLISTTTAGTAYIDGVRVNKDATSKTYTATKWTYVDLSSSGTYTYSETVIGASEPSTTANSIRIARVSTDGTQVAAVRDDRITSIQLETNEDFFRTGLTLSATTPDTLIVAPGVAYHGTTRVSKSANVSLSLGTATDWATGVSGRATETYGYIVVNSAGSIKLTTTAPTKTDTSGNSAGILRYSVISTDYWRVLGWFYMNDTGSGNITDSDSTVSDEPDTFGNFKDGAVSNAVKVVANDDVSTTSNTYVGINNMTIDCVTTGGPVHIMFTATLLNGGGASDGYGIRIYVDSVQKIAKEWDSTGANQGLVTWQGSLSSGTHNVRAQWQNGSTNIQHDGANDGGRILTLTEL